MKSAVRLGTDSVCVTETMTIYRGVKNTTMEKLGVGSSQFNFEPAYRPDTVVKEFILG